MDKISLIRRCYGHFFLKRLKRVFELCQTKKKLNYLGVLRDLHKYACVIPVKLKATNDEHSGVIDAGMLPGQAYGADITGPFALPNLTGNVYMLDIIDSATHRFR